jgi:hypothetical protein
MEVLPNNFADWPVDRQPASTHARRSWGRATSKLIVLAMVGGLIGIVAYRWVVVVEDPGPPQTARLTTVAPVDEGSSPETETQPELTVTGLLGNHAESQNWSGYAAIEGGYTAVSAMWNVPELTLSTTSGVDATWVGIGGLRSRDLIQAGTQRTVSGDGRTQQEAWIELLPRASETVPLTLRPGDSVRVSIEQQGPEMWLIVLSNLSSGKDYQVTRRYASSLSSAEWVEEAPSSGRGRLLPLDDFGTLRFTRAWTVKDDQVLNLAQAGAHAITMITPGGLHLIEPSELGMDGASFSVTRTSVPSSRRRR